MLTGAGLLWMGWSGFNGGAPFSANLISGLAVLNTHICAATSLLTWTMMDVIVFKKPSVIGAVQGMMTGLVTITPAAGKPTTSHSTLKEIERRIKVGITLLLVRLNQVETKDGSS